MILCFCLIVTIEMVQVVVEGKPFTLTQTDVTKSTLIKMDHLDPDMIALKKKTRAFIQYALFKLTIEIMCGVIIKCLFSLIRK